MAIQKDYLEYLCGQLPYHGIAVAVLNYVSQFADDDPAIEHFQNEIKTLLDTGVCGKRTL